MGLRWKGASAVASGEGLDEFDVFDLVASLVEKSLVLAEPSGDALRYRLLESTRAYASEELREAGERDLLAGRHLRYLRDWFAEIHDRQEATVRSAEKAAAFVTELEGVRFALDDALAHCESVAGAELLAAIERSWTQGFGREGIARNEAFISALPGDEVLLLAKLCATLAGLLCDENMSAPALEVATRARAYARTSADGPTLAFALRWYATAKTLLGNFADADAALNEAAAISLASARLRLAITEVRVFLSKECGDLDAAARGYEQGIVEHRALGNLRNAHGYVLNLSEVEYARGRTAHAIALVRDVLPALRTGADRRVCAIALEGLAGYLAAGDDLPGAIEAAHEAIATLAHDPDNNTIIFALELLALVDALQDRFPRAARLIAYVDSAFAKLGTKRRRVSQMTYDRLTALLNAKLPPEDRAHLAAEGAALTPEAAVALALERGTPS